MVKGFVLWGLSVLSFALQAEVLPDFTQKPAHWMAQLPWTALSFQKAIPYGVAFVQSDDGHTLHFLPLLVEKMAGLSYLSIADPRSATFSYQLNPSFIHGAFHRYSASERWEELSVLLGVNTVVLTPPGQDWAVIGSEKGHVVERKFFPPAEIDAQHLYPWLRDSLGYNGVIVALRETYCLVVSYRDLLKKDAQGLVLADSAETFFVEEKKKKGEALIQAVSVEGNVGIFRSMIQAQGVTFQVGDKVVF